MSDETYLGDSVYASFDGAQIKLRAPSAHLGKCEQEIYLDEATFDALVSFVEKTFDVAITIKPKE